MENTLSDVSFGEDHSILGVLIVAGAAVGGIVAGWFISRVCLNKAFDERISMLEGRVKAKAVLATPAKA